MGNFDFTPFCLFWQDWRYFILFSNFYGQNFVKSAIISKMEEKKKKKKLKNFFVYGGLLLLVLFVIITCVVINFKNKQLEQIEQSNENIPKIEKIL